MLCFLLQEVLDQSSSAVSDFLSRLPESTEGASVAMNPVSEQAAQSLLQAKDEGFVVPTQVWFDFCRGYMAWGCIALLCISFWGFLGNVALRVRAILFLPSLQYCKWEVEMLTLLDPY